jgi:hypothetical protein
MATSHNSSLSSQHCRRAFSGGTAPPCIRITFGSMLRRRRRFHARRRVDGFAEVFWNRRQPRHLLSAEVLIVKSYRYDGILVLVLWFCEE